MPCRGRVDNAAGEIGCENFDAPASQAMRLFVEQHGERIRLLARRAGGAPDADFPAVLPRLQKMREDDLAKIVERHAIAKEEGFVGRHRFDDFAFDIFVRAGEEQLDESAKSGNAELLNQRLQAAFGEIGLLGIE